MPRSENSADCRLLTRAGSVLLAIGLLTPAVTAQVQAQADPTNAQEPRQLTGTAVLERYVDALGGREAVFGVERREVWGRYEGPEFKFPARLRMWYEKPESFHLTLDEPSGPRYELMHTPEATWEMGFSLSAPSHVRHPIRRLIIKEDADLYQEANYAERYETLTLRGMNTFEGRNMLEVLAAPEPNTGRQRLLYIDPETYLLQGYITVTFDGEKQIRITVILTDYKEFDGVKFATRTEIRTDGIEEPAVFVFDKMVVNGEPHDFEVPDSLPEFDPESATDESDSSDDDGNGEDKAPDAG